MSLDHFCQEELERILPHALLDNKMYWRDTTGGLTPLKPPLAAIAMMLWLTPPWAEKLAAAAMLGGGRPPQMGQGLLLQRWVDPSLVAGCWCC